MIQEDIAGLLYGSCGRTDWAGVVYACPELDSGMNGHSGSPLYVRRPAREATAEQAGCTRPSNVRLIPLKDTEN